MLVSDAIVEYNYAVLRLSPNTRKWYMSRLNCFATWCNERDIPLEKAKPIEIRKYLEHLRTTPSNRTGELLSSYTVHGHARTLRTFLRWAHNEEDLEQFVTQKATRVDMPRIDKKIIEVFTPQELQSLLAACGKEDTLELQYRDKAVISLLFDAGIRASELTTLTLDGVVLKPGNSYIRVFGKGRKEREVGLGKASSFSLQKYIHRYRKGTEACVFLSRKRAPLTVSGLDQMLYRVAEWAGVEDAHAHKFRHTFAVNYLENGGDLFDLTRLMGHSTTEVTRLYLEAYSSKQARQKGISVLDNLK